MGTLNVDAINDAAGSITALDVTKEIGIWQFVSTAAVTAAANISVTGIAAGYDYLFQFEAICPTTDANQLAIRFSLDAGSSYKEGASDYGWSSNLTADGADNEITVVNGSGSWGNDSGNQSHIAITLVNPGGTGEPTMLYGNGVIWNSDATPLLADVAFGGSYLIATTAVDAIQFGWTTNYGTNTFKAQGDITVWRRRRS
jgi:hypothetical protein